MNVKKKRPDMPLVSILINNYNYGHYLRAAINSALEQTYPNVEIIVVDDGSTDNSREIISEFGNKIIPVLKENGGQASAFNAGFAASKGDIICFLDSDDLFLPNKVEVVVKAMHHNSVGWCFHYNIKLKTNEVDEKLKELAKLSDAKPLGSMLSEIDFRSQIKKAKLPSFAPATSGLCYRRSLLKKIFPLPVAEDVYVNDLYLKYASIALSKGCILKKTLAIQIFHERNLHRLKNGSRRQKRRIKVDVISSYWMQVKFPELKELAGKLLARGIGASLAIRNQKVLDRNIIKKHLAMIPFLGKIKLPLNILYYYFTIKNSILHRNKE
jgi:glycosyltransferase involved in cell wall biosynthesis